MGFVQHIQVITMLENLSQNKAEEENENKTKDLQKISCFLRPHRDVLKKIKKKYMFS
jgi:hypothetical protein